MYIFTMVVAATPVYVYFYIYTYICSGAGVDRVVLKSWSMCSAASPLLRFGGRRAVCLRGNHVIAGRRRVSVAPPYCGLEVGL